MFESGTSNRLGVQVAGVVTPFIKPGDNLLKIVKTSVYDAIGQENIEDGDIIGVTEAVLAVSQRNFVMAEQIQKCISQLFGKQIALVDPIQSRNRFLDVLKAIAGTPTLEKVYIFMTYPSDEVGNHFFPDGLLYEKGISSDRVFSVEEFYETFGKPAHQFTGVNYIEKYIEACEGKAEIILCNNFPVIPSYCGESLVCSIHRRNMVKALLRVHGADKVYDLSDVLCTPVDGSGYSPEYGLYGTNKMDGYLKLMPKDSPKFVEALQKEIYEETGKMVEVLVFGDGAFKDPVGDIYELADPTTTLGATNGLMGKPEEVKLKLVMSQNPDKSDEEIQEIIRKEKENRKNCGISNESSLGTTPRQITDLVASLCDLTVGSGDRRTPVVYIKGYLRK